MRLNQLDHQLMDKTPDHSHVQMIEILHELLIEHDDHLLEGLVQDLNLKKKNCQSDRILV